MYVDIVPNRKSPPAILLREARREGNKTRKKTLANISHWPMEKIQMLRRVLKGEELVPAAEAFHIEQSLPHGHVEAILGTLRKIGLESIIASRRSRERDLVVAMIVEQILHHDSKLADTRNWHSTSLAGELGVEDADENDLYSALDWLLGRQRRIEKKLAKLHFSEGSFAFYDVTSSYSDSIRKLLEKGYLEASLFDSQNIAEIRWPEHPNERFIACYNPLLAVERKRKRGQLLEATEASLNRIKREVNRRTKKLLKKAEIGVKVGKVLNKYKVGRHFELSIEDNKLEWLWREEQIRQEEELDGIYIVRTSETKESISTEDTVRKYKNLSRIEQIYRTVKGLDILIRPIRHRTERHVRAHISLCMLSYYVEWHMRKALAPILFEDEEVDSLRESRDPVAKAEPSESAKRKKTKLVTPDGFAVHSFRTLLNALGTRCKNRCRLKGGGPETTFTQLTEFDALQSRAFDLLGLTHPVR